MLSKYEAAIERGQELAEQSGKVARRLQTLAREVWKTPSTDVFMAEYVALHLRLKTGD